MAATALTAACTASPALAPPRSAEDSACTALPAARAPAPRTGSQGHGAKMPPVPGVLDDVAARSPDSAVAVGNTGTTSRSRPLVALWNGTVWKALSDWALPPSSSLNGVAVFPGGAWAVGKYGNTEHKQLGKAFILRVTGTTVRKVPIPRMVYGTGLLDVAAPSATDAWAVGSNGNLALILHWNGTAWSRAQLPTTIARVLNQAHGVAAPSGKDVWIASLWWLVHWDGRRWEMVTPQIGIRYALNDVAATSANNVWAVGDGLDKQVVVILHWNGQRWTCAVSPRMPFTYLVGVSTSSPDNAWAVGSYFDSTYSTDRAWVLHWNGRGWKQVIVSHPGQMSGVAVIPNSANAWTVGAATWPLKLN